MTELRRLWDQAVQAAEARGYISGRLGKADASGNVTILVTNKPNHCYVSLGPEGDQGVTTAINVGAPRIAWVPIRLKRERGQLYIEGLDRTPGRLEAFFGGQAAQGSVPYHHHRIGSGLEYEVEALRLEPGRVVPTSGMTVGVNAFRYFYNGAWDTWENDATLDLTPYKPASGKWAWVVVGVNPATNALVAAKGTDQDAQADLTVALIDSVSFSNYIPCGAVQVAEADTAVTDISRWLDGRGWLNMGPVNLGDLGDVTVSSPAENDSIWHDGSGWVHGRGHRLNMATAVQTLTISSGVLSIDAIDAQHGLIDVRGEGDADDDLTTITGGQIGDVIVLHVANALTYGAITAKNSGNINVVNDVVLGDDSAGLAIVLTAAGWNPLSATQFSLLLDDLVDVTLTSPVENNALVYNGSGWINSNSRRPNLNTSQTVTISSGAINLSSYKRNAIFNVRGEGSSDDVLEEISGIAAGDIIILYASDTATYGEITIFGSGFYQSGSIVLDNANKFVVFVAASASLLIPLQGYNFQSLDGVTTSSVADNDKLYYDSADKQWKNSAHLEGIVKLASSSVTISSGAVTASGSVVVLSAESGTADDLDTLNPADAVLALVCLQVASGHVITVKHGTGNIRTASGADVTLNNVYDQLWLYKRWAAGDWMEFNAR